tara:strand:- start:1592 stop:2491 length:900 start_codon:yes stop_codon:yes gene_type:complete
MNLKNKNILITGVHGFIGSNLNKILKKENKVIGLGNKKNKNKLNYKDKVTYENLDKLEFDPDIIFNCVGSGTIKEAEKDTTRSKQNDLLTTKAVLNFANSLRKKIILVFFSSAAVYGNNFTKLKPISNYGKNKLKSEIYLKKHKNKNINLIIIRYFSIYGNGLRKQLIWDTCNKVIKNKFDFYGTGKERRSWLHIDDAIDIALLAINKSKITNAKCLTLDGHADNILKNYEIINKIISLFKFNKFSKFNQFNDKFNPRDQISKCNKLKNWKWKSKTDLDYGLKKYIKWFKKQNNYLNLR